MVNNKTSGVGKEQSNRIYAAAMQIQNILDLLSG